MNKYYVHIYTKYLAVPVGGHKTPREKVMKHQTEVLTPQS